MDTFLNNNDSNEDIVVAKIKNRRGYKVNLPQPLSSGEFGWCLDTRELYIGLDGNASAVIGVTDTSTAQALLDDSIVEFGSKWTFLNGTINGSVDVDGNKEREESFMPLYSSIDSNEMISDPTLVKSIEGNVDILYRLTSAMESSIPSGLLPASSRVTTVEKTSVSSAKVIVNITGGVISLASASPDPLVRSDAGLGYADGEVVQIFNPNGNAARLQVTTEGTGEGRVQSFSFLSGGSGFTDASSVKMQVSLPNTAERVALADPSSAVITSGELISINIDPLRKGKGYMTRPYVSVTGGGASTQAVVKAIWDSINREISGLLVVSGGVGYTSPPTIEVREPQSQYMYRFRYDVAIIDDTNAGAGVFNTAINAFPDSMYPSDMLVSDERQSDILGTGGYGHAVTVDSSGNTVVAMDTATQASAVSGLLNANSGSTANIAMTSQNVEILTEYSTLPTPPPITVIPVADLTTAVLPTTGANAWTDVMIDDANNPGNTIVMSFDPTLTDVINLDLSAKATSVDYMCAGRATIVSMSGTADMSYSSTSVVGAGVTGQIALRAIISGGQIVIQYWSDVASTLNLKYANLKWMA